MIHDGKAIVLGPMRTFSCMSSPGMNMQGNWQACCNVPAGSFLFSSPGDLVEGKRQVDEAEIIACYVAPHKDTNEQNASPRLSQRCGMIHLFRRQYRPKDAEAEGCMCHCEEDRKAEPAEPQRPSVREVED